MKKLVAAALPFVFWGCTSNSTSVQSSVPPLIPPAGGSTTQGTSGGMWGGTTGGQSVLTSTQSAAVSNGRLTDPAGKQNYFPMADGNTWIYDGEIKATTGT